MPHSFFLALIMLPSWNIELLSLMVASSIIFWFMWLQLDPLVMAALPLSMRRELELEYKRQVKKPDRLTASKPKSEVESKVPRGPVGEPQIKCNGGYPTSLKDLWIGSPPKWVNLFKDYRGAGESPHFPFVSPKA